MSVPAIFEEAMPLTALAGKTPKQTFYSVVHSEKRKADGVVVQVGNGAQSMPIVTVEPDVEWVDPRDLLELDSGKQFVGDPLRDQPFVIGCHRAPPCASENEPPTAGTTPARRPSTRGS
jgi:hypothetical protein